MEGALKSAKARRGAKRAVVDITPMVPNAEVAAVYRIRGKPKPGAPTETPEDPDPADASDFEVAAAPARKKQKPKGNFLEEKRMQKVRRREEKVLMGPTVVPSVAAAAAAAKYVHVRVMCDPMTILNSLIRELFPDAVELDVAERMHCAWLRLSGVSAVDAAVSGGPYAMAGVPIKVDRGRKAPEEVFVSFPGRTVLGAFLSGFFPGVKDVIEAADNCVRARFQTKALATAAIRKGTVPSNAGPLCAAGQWGTEPAVPDF